MCKTFHYNILYEDIILEVESKAKERESVLCMGRQDNAVQRTTLFWTSIQWCKFMGQELCETHQTERGKL